MQQDIEKAWAQAKISYGNTYATQTDIITNFLNEPDLPLDIFKELVIDYGPYLYYTHDPDFYPTQEPAYKAFTQQIIEHKHFTPEIYAEIISALEIRWWGDDPIAYSILIAHLKEATKG